ncbi:nuclear transport factor 2 family protein [Sphingobium sp. CAP-1]|uniref:nuclear transport factor 2 family protein n=1 Tax=Sphingobium sp. CAP-1 TaxID=2676077 RepID=UPI0018AD1EAD|nr:nuclear transport factor 2 family protein [Sphingobium sp. CAP-1]
MITVEDKIAIAELVAHFTRCSDFGDWDGLARLYTADVVTEMEGIAIRYVGIEQQIEHARESDRQAEGKNRHYNFNLIVSEQDGDVHADYAFMNVNAGPVPMASKIVVTGRQRDTVVKTDAGWKIAHRFVQFDQNVQLDF